MGLRAAKQLDSKADYLGYTLQRSALLDISVADIGRSEIEARIALGDFSGALSLIYTIVPREHRLRLLCVVANSQRKRGEAISPELSGEIHRLYAELDPSDLGDLAIEIAADLLQYDAAMAISLVERTANTEAGDNALDWAFVQLSLSAASRDDSTQTNPGVVSDDLAGALRKRIKGEAARTMSSAAAMLLGEYTDSQVIDEVHHFPRTGDKLFLLRQWAVIHPRHEHASQVVDYALEQMVSSAEYAPNASVLRDLATPLPFIDEVATRTRLLDGLDRQAETVRHLGPTEDFVRLQLLLLQTQMTLDLEGARSRVLNVFSFAKSLPDLTVKAECLAILASTLSLIDGQGVFKKLTRCTAIAILY